ncbi:DUF6517 family protein [Haloarcula litorea]|uniref:DUF6517 family protein n=1 Tax=Haloarcula litorea TaxID=3032579 RepID=UPI0023E83FB3|nr:DUF6517 family protein [Halomicroarcula sp. GDY20]
MNRRALAVVLLAVAVAGCSGGPSRAVASGSPATVQAGTLDGTGYEHAGTENRTLNTTVSATISGDVEMSADRPVTATTPVATYRRTTDAGPALILVATAPAVRPIENQPLVRNPLTTLTPGALVGYLQSTYAVDSLSDGENTTVELLGNETTAETFEGTGTLSGESVAVRVTTASVRDGDEFVTVAAVHPASIEERARVRQLLAGVEH